MKNFDFLLICIIFVLSFLFSSCSLMVNTLLIRDARVENKETINKYLTDENYPLTYNYVLASDGDTMSIVSNHLKSFNSEILIFDRAGNKYCYFPDAGSFDIQYISESSEKACPANVLRIAFDDFENNFSICAIDSTKLSSYLLDMEPIGNSISNPLDDIHDYYLVKYWSKNLGRKSDIKYNINNLASLHNETKYDIGVILINTDLQEDWGLKKNGKWKIKFKMNNKYEGGLKFGDLPYKKK